MLKNLFNKLKAKTASDTNYSKIIPLFHLYSTRANYSKTPQLECDYSILKP
jgi:hypothetical protein